MYRFFLPLLLLGCSGAGFSETEPSDTSSSDAGELPSITTTKPTEDSTTAPTPNHDSSPETPTTDPDPAMDSGSETSPNTGTDPDMDSGTDPVEPPDPTEPDSGPDTDPSPPEITIQGFESADLFVLDNARCSGESFGNHSKIDVVIQTHYPPAWQYQYLELCIYSGNSVVCSDGQFKQELTSTCRVDWPGKGVKGISCTFDFALTGDLTAEFKEQHFSKHGYTLQLRNKTEQLVYYEIVVAPHSEQCNDLTFVCLEQPVGNFIKVSGL